MKFTKNLFYTILISVFILEGCSKNNDNIDETLTKEKRTFFLIIKKRGKDAARRFNAHIHARGWSGRRKHPCRKFHRFREGHDV